MAESRKFKNLHSDTWCPIPFNTISFHPAGMLTRCMMSQEPMGTDIDSEEFRNLRKTMLDGKWDLPGCNSCHVKEQAELFSQRQNWLTDTMQRTLGYPEPYASPKITENKISHLFVNYSNICNFKCRMCSADYSNSLIPENKHMSKLFPDVEQVVNVNPKNFNDINSYLLKNAHLVNNIKSIWITGGEPFMDNSVYDLLEIIKLHGHPEKIVMTITTNGSKLNLNKLQSFDCLKQLKLDLSIDSAGRMFEYMRSNGVFTWKQMEKLCYDLGEFSRRNKKWFDYQINSSYQIFNYNNISDFYDFIYDTGGQVNLRMLMYPIHFRASIMPDHMKKEALAMCDIVERRYLNFDETFVKGIPEVRKMLTKKLTVIESAGARKKLELFKEYTKAQDSFRNCYLYDYHDKLGDFVYGPKQQDLFG